MEKKSEEKKVTIHSQQGRLSAKEILNKSPSIVKNVHLQDILNVERKCDHDGSVVVDSVLAPNVMEKE